jgi:hypothetical protein
MKTAKEKTLKDWMKAIDQRIMYLEMLGDQRNQRIMYLEMLGEETKSMLKKHMEYDIILYIISKRKKSEADSHILSKLDIIEELTRELPK